MNVSIALLAIISKLDSLRDEPAKKFSNTKEAIAYLKKMIK